MQTKYIFEVLDEIKAADGNRTDIINIIKNNKSKSLAIVFMANYGHPVAIMEADHMPDYKEDDAPLGMSFTTLAKETKAFQYFFTPGIKIKPQSLERLYINICEGLCPEEAKIFTDVVTKSLYIKGLDYDVINEGFGEVFLSEPVERLEHADGNTT